MFLEREGRYLIARIMLRSLHLTTSQIAGGGKDLFDYADGFGCVTLGTCDGVADKMSVNHYVQKSRVDVPPTGL